MAFNSILLTDSYKVTQYNQYPPDTAAIYSYFESRGGLFDEVTFFGLQYILKEYLTKRVTLNDLLLARETLKYHFGGKDLMHYEGWRHIFMDHDGYLPLRIKAVPEGMTVPVRNVLMTVENTCPKCYWLTNYMETLLVQTWYPTTVATLSRQIKKLLKRYLEKTGDTAGLNFKLHDFGFRGVSSVESAGIGGVAHLVNFLGTDTLHALMFAEKYYYEQMAGFSIPASEHSTMTSWGRDREAEAYDNMLKQFPDALVAVVSDSYDIYNACRNIWGGTLRAAVMGRKGTVVVRPDSGYPPEVVKNVLDALGEKFGFTMNSKGYKMLPPQIRVIQGDGIDYGMIQEICKRLEEHSWSVDNVAFGMGGALLQKLHRDTQRFAFKCAARQTTSGTWLPVSKAPSTDPTKASKAGRMKLVFEDGKIQTVPTTVLKDDLLITVFENGKLLIDHSLDEVRKRAAL